MTLVTIAISNDIKTGSVKEAKFLVPDLGIYCSRLWHWVVVPARRPMEHGGPERQPYTIVDYIPQSGTKNLASGCHKLAKGGGRGHQVNRTKNKCQQMLC